MRPAHLRRMNVSEAVRAELAISGAVDRARHDDARGAGVAHSADVVLGVRGVADERQFHRSIHLFEGLAHFERMILGLQAAYVEEIPARLQPEFGQHFRALHFADFGAVGDEDALLAIAPAVVFLDGERVSDPPRWAEFGEPLRDQIPGARRAVPLLALAFDADRKS